MPGLTVGADSATTLIDLIRHGEPEGGPRFRGAQDDPLSATGWEQMETAIASCCHWDAVLTSPLLRCRGFAESVARQCQLPLYIEDRLREIAFGEWEGLTADVIRERWGKRLELFWADAQNNPPPGGELLSHFQQRVLAAWDEWTARLSGQNILLVGHGGVIRVILGHILGISQERTLSSISMPYGWCSRVRLDRTLHGDLDCLMAHSSHVIPIERASH